MSYALVQFYRDSFRALRHAFAKFTNRTGTADNGVNWLADVNMLPKKIPNARIFVWGYDADTHRKDYLSEAYLHQHGSQLVGELSDERCLDGTEKRPIIFIGHSLGGIVIKSVRETNTRFAWYLICSRLLSIRTERTQVT